MTRIYIDEEKGSDSSELHYGTEPAPYKTLIYAFSKHSIEEKGISDKVKIPAIEPFNTQTPPEPAAEAIVHPTTQSVDAVQYFLKKPGEKDYNPAPKSALKSARKGHDAQVKKAETAIRLAKKEAEDRIILDEAIQKSKEVKVSEDPSLPLAVLIDLTETNPSVIGTLCHDKKEMAKETITHITMPKPVRVRVQGRVEFKREQGQLLFVIIRRGMHQMQCVLAGQLAKSYDIMTLTLETSIEMRGMLWEVPAKQVVDKDGILGMKQHHAPLNRELRVDYYKVIGYAPAGDDAFLNAVTKPKYRHLEIRTKKFRQVMLVRSIVEDAFHTVYKEKKITKTTLPTMVMTQCEGASTLFDFDYYGVKAYLTQSCQLYLESTLPSLGNVYCMEKSFRAEKSDTRRHLAEYSHIEAELDFITFSNLLEHLEDVLCRVVELVLANESARQIITEMNPKFGIIKRPFKRMRYSEVIEWLQKNGIQFVIREKPREERDYKYGDDIQEAAERKMVDTLKVPIFLTHFPAEQKSFYMQRDLENNDLTESVDLLMPNVGEIVGGSMRMWKYDELLAAYKHQGIDPKPYYWYTDQRKYGSSPHGGYGIGEERFLAWILNLWTVRETVFYPRYMDNCEP